MDTSKISFGEMIAGASGVLLFIFLFLPWYGAEAGGLSENFNAWRSFGFIDILLLLVVLVAVGATLARMAGAVPELPAPLGQIVAGAGALAVVLIVYRLLDMPTPDIEQIDYSRKIGIFLGLIAAAGITYGGFTAANEQASGAAPAPGR